MNRDKLYMGGKGVAKRTEELIERSWFCFWWFCLGFIINLICNLAASIVVREYKQELLGLGIMGVGILLFIAFTIPWAMAVWKLRKHTKRMQAETKKYGKGWSES